LRRVIPGLEVLILIKKSLNNEISLRDMFKKASKSGYKSTNVVSPDPLSPTPSILQL
jgi:hypothetical protein